MGRGFLPVKDLDLLGWAESVALLIEPDPQAYGLSSADAAQFLDARSAFAVAMPLTVPNVRSRFTVATKVEARRVLENAARRLNGLIKSAGVASDAQIIELGLTVAKTTYRRIGRPEARAFVTVRSVVGQSMLLTIHADAESRAVLPADVANVALSHWIGDGAPTDYAQWPAAAQVARARIALTIDAPLGTPVHFVARYLNRRGEAGPWSEVTSTHAMGGMTFGRHLLAA